MTSTTFLARHEGSHAVVLVDDRVSSRWKTDDLTDLDYTPLPLVTRSNAEKDFQFTQEVRVASAPAAPVKLSDTRHAEVAGAASSSSRRTTTRTRSTPSRRSCSRRSSRSPVDQHSPEAALDDGGVGVYGQGTVTFGNKIDATVGARVDYENKKADLNTFYAPPIFPATVVDAEKSFSNVSPQFAFSYHVTPRRHDLRARSAAASRRAASIPASPPGSEAYDEEHTWHVEGGLKSAVGRTA